MESRKVIQVEEKVPFKMLVPLSIQHMFAMFGASVLVPFMFGIQPCHRSSDERYRNTSVHSDHQR